MFLVTALTSKSNFIIYSYLIPWAPGRNLAFIKCGQISEIGGRVTNTAKKLSGLFLTV